MRLKINFGRPFASSLVILFLSQEHYPANAQSGVQPPSPYDPGQNFSHSMAVVAAFLMCAFFFLAFLPMYIRACMEGSPAPTDPTGRSRHHGLDPAVIETFPILVYSAVKELKMGKGALECAVCLSEFEDHETLRLLPSCCHVFHPECIDAWLVSRSTCPVCRAKLTRAEFAPKAAQTTETSRENSTPGDGGRENFEVWINVEDNQTAADHPSRGEIWGKFPRSHSTGHLVVQPGEKTERYTLRLPEEVRKQIMVSKRLRRSSSYDVILGRDSEGSHRGKTGGVDRQVGRPDWWPPFVKSSGKGMMTSKKMPSDYLDAEAKGAQESSVSSPV